MSEGEGKRDSSWVVHHGSVPGALDALDAESVHAVVCDPPYELGFMGRSWDSSGVAFRSETWAACLRVLKPGGHLLAFGGSRTSHRIACAIEDAGFELRDVIVWLYTSGFPKALDVSKAIDKRRNWTALPALQGAIGAARKALGISQSEAARRCGLIAPGERLGGGGFMWFETGLRVPTREQWPALKAALELGNGFDACFEEAEREVTGTVEEWDDRSTYAITSKDGYRRDKPATPEAEEWLGWKTALKPAYEPVILARKPLESTVAAGVLQHRTGALNIDGCRIPDIGEARATRRNSVTLGCSSGGIMAAGAPVDVEQHPMGRYPANVAHDDSSEVRFHLGDIRRCYYSPKASTADREEGTGELEVGMLNRVNPGGIENDPKWAPRQRKNTHVTVKPSGLMEWLVRLVTPPGGIVLDPFTGSGTTGVAALRQGFQFVGVEMVEEHVKIARARIGWAALHPLDRAAKQAEDDGQASLFGKPVAEVLK